MASAAAERAPARLGRTVTAVSLDRPDEVRTAAMIAGWQLGLLALAGAGLAGVLWLAGLRWMANAALLDLVPTVCGLATIPCLLRGHQWARRILESVLALKALTPLPAVVALLFQVYATLTGGDVLVQSSTLVRSAVALGVLTAPSAWAVRLLESSESREWFGRHALAAGVAGRRPGTVTAAAMIGLVHGLTSLLLGGGLIVTLAIQAGRPRWPDAAIRQIPWLDYAQRQLQIELILAAIGVAAALAALSHHNVGRRVLEVVLLLRIVPPAMIAIDQAAMYPLSDGLGLPSSLRLWFLLPAMVTIVLWVWPAAVTIWLLESRDTRSWYARVLPAPRSGR